MTSRRKNEQGKSAGLLTGKGEQENRRDNKNKVNQPHKSALPLVPLFPSSLLSPFLALSLSKVAVALFWLLNLRAKISIGK
jgi:hypothetical protein